MSRLAKNIVKSDPFGLLKNFPVVIQQPIHWGDQDAFGHLNNVQFLRFMESSRIAYMLEMFDYKKVMDETGIGPIIYRIDCKYLGQVTYPDILYIGTTIEMNSIRERSYVMKHTIVSESSQKVVAEADVVIVSFNYKTNEKSIHPPTFLESVKRVESRVDSTIQQV